MTFILALMNLLLIAISIAAPAILTLMLKAVLAEERQALEEDRADLRAIEGRVAMQRAKLELLTHGILFPEEN